MLNTVPGRALASGMGCNIGVILLKFLIKIFIALIHYFILSPSPTVKQ